VTKTRQKDWQNLTFFAYDGITRDLVVGN
jgi:hypothetical protein